MKTFHSLLALVLSVSLLGFGSPSAAARDFGVFKVTATIPVVRVVNQDDPDAKLVTKTLTTNDVINLALGIALGTPVKATDNHVLAAVITYEDQATPLSKLVIYDPSKTGSAGIVTTVAEMGTLTFLNTGGAGAKNSGAGVAIGAFTPTTLGDKDHFAILSGEYCGQGSGGGRHLLGPGFTTFTPSPTGSATFAGKFKFHFKDKDGNLVVWDGLVLKGSLKLTAKPVATYQE